MMSDGALSQDEIEALLQGADDAFSGGAGNPQVAQNATLDKKLIEEACSIITENQAFSLSSISTKPTTIKNVVANVSDVETLQKLLSGKILEAKVAYSGDAKGNMYYYLRESEAIIISTLMMGQPETELTDMVAQVLKEAISQMVGVSDNALIARFGGSLNLENIEMNVLPDTTAINIQNPVIVASSSLTIEGEIENAPFVFAIDYPLMESLLATTQSNNDATNNGGVMDIGEFGQAAGANNQNSINVQHADFNSLMPAPDIQGSSNIGLLMDVTMSVTVELGRATMTIRDILSLGEGSIIELQKLAGEPVDLLVNGKLIARGEVVVIDENFGVRVTDIINPMDRLVSGKNK